MKLRIPQFSMRVLVIVMLLFGAALGLVGRELFQIRTKAEAQRTLVEQLKSKGVRFVEEDRADLTILESFAVWLGGKGGLPVVSQVTLPQSGLHEDDLNQIAKLEGLKSINDHGANFSTKGLELLGKNPTLKNVVLYKGWQGGESGAIGLLSGNTPLSMIILGSSPVNDEFVERASRLPSLEHLQIDARQVSPKAIRMLGDAPNLMELSLTSAKELGTALESLGQHPNLRTLGLHDYTFGVGELEAIEKADQIEQMLIEAPQFPPGILRSVAGMENLKSLALIGKMEEAEQFYPFESPKIAMLGLQGLPPSCRGLMESLVQCKSLTSILLADVALKDSEFERLSAAKGLQSIAIGAGPSTEAISRLQKLLPNCTVTMRDRQGRILIYQPGGAFEIRQPPPIVEKEALPIDKGASAKNW